MEENYSKEKALVVTGAGGFLGKNLVERALESGWKVRALIHENNPFESTHQSLTIVKWDLDHVNELSNVFDNAHAVIHLAAHIPSNFYNTEYASQCYKYNFLGTLALLRLAQKQNVSHFIYFSAGNAYAVKDTPAVEDDPLYPVGRATIYLSSKIAGDIITEHFRRNYSLPATILRLSTPYGLGNNSIVNTMISSFKKEIPVKLYNNGSHSADFVFVDDITKATLSVIDTKSMGIFNIGSGVRYNLIQIANMIADQLKADINLINIEPILGDEIVDRYPVLDCTKAKNEWGYSSISFDNGIKNMVQ